VAEWTAAGLRGLDGAPVALPPDTRAALLMPAGAEGPAWLVTPNYQALWRYNRADAYALAIGLLSDALREGRDEAGPRRAWPAEDIVLSRAGLRSLQGWLRRAGHCEVTADGRDGPRTRAALSQQAQRLGWPADVRPVRRVWAALKDQPPPAGAVACDPPVAADAAPAPAPASVPAPTAVPAASR
jgi:glucose-6-phosphate 1-epimerase